MSTRPLALLLVSALAFGACSGSDAGGNDPDGARLPVATPTSERGRVVGLVGTLSGPGSVRGNDAFEGADLAVARLNRDLDRNELPFELVTLDDEGDPTHATELIQGLAESDRTVGIVYAGPPEGLPPANDILAAAGIPAVMVYGDLYSARLLRSHLFQVSPPMVWQARRIAAYLGRDRGYDLVGLLAQRSLSGNTAVASARSALGAEGGIRSISARYEGEEDIGQAIDRLEEARVEAIVVQAPQRTFGTVLETLAERDAGYRSTTGARTASLPLRARRRKARRGVWRPQVIGFEEAIGTEVGARIPAGTVAADTYARGVDYLPVDSFVAFREAFEDWWDMRPLGWELRSYEAVRMVGWAARRANEGDDLARVLETMTGERFGGLDVTFGPDDHTAAGQTTVGLWVVPSGAAGVRERESRPQDLPWVPLARGFSTDGNRTDVLPQDWPELFRDAPPPEAPAPRVRSARFGVTTGRGDPIH